MKKRDAAITTLLARTTDFRDKITGGHVIRTTGYVKIMVEELMKNPIEGYMVDESTAESIITSAKLHDIGKIAIPDSILTKKSRLSDEEFDMMKKHTIFGLEILENGLIDFEDRNFLKIAKEMILEHHEKWNGKGILLVLRQMKYLFQQEL